MPMPTEQTADGLSFFSSITLHGLASSSTSGNPESLTLFRNESFPPKRFRWYRSEECLTEIDSEWKSLPVPVGKAHAELQLLERLNEGRISIVYSARLLCIRQCPDGDLLEPDFMPRPLPEQFCVKLAKAEFIRSLARDAWFYEKLAKEDGCQGVITPLCFGFFTTTLPHTLEIGAWSKMECIPQKYDHEQLYDRFHDDKEEDIGAYTNDQRKCREDCPWILKRWMSRPDSSSIVGVLITERLGDCFSKDSAFGRNELLEESREEINEILDDLSAVGIMHNDVKFNNFLRPNFSSPSSSSSSSPSSAPTLSSSPLLQICPRHNRAHSWRIIDFDRSMKWGKSVPQDVKHFTKMQRTVFKHGFFWGEPF